jgi:hypothetical protein
MPKVILHMQKDLHHTLKENNVPLEDMLHTQKVTGL